MKRFSLIALLLSYFILIAFLSYYPKFSKQGVEATISYDVAGYYLYLPAIFIYHDVHHLKFQEEMNNKYQYTPGTYQGVQLPDGNYTMKYPIGAAVMYAPFFFIAHSWALITGHNADGFSAPYQIMLSLGCLLYAFLGLWMLRKILLLYFSEVVTGITLLALVLATNYLNYSAIDNAMTHNLLFTVFTFIIWFTIKFYERPSFGHSAILGIFCGLATIIRPTDIIICCIPLLWNIKSFADMKLRLVLLFQNKLKIVLFILSAFLIGSIQLIYWKITTGSFVFYSYEEQGFDWSSPYLKEGFFSYKKGWWLYTPFMAAIIPGFIFFYRQHKQLFFSIFLFTLLNIYIAFSWSIWWYGGSLGQRSMVESYALLSFPIAAMFTALLNANKFVRFVTLLILVFSVWYNITLTIQAHHKQGILDAENTNRTYFWATFCRLNINTDIKRFLDTDEVYKGQPNGIEPLYFNDIEYDTLHIDTTSKLNGKKSLFVSANEQFTQAYAVPMPPEGTSWLRVSGDFISDNITADVWKMPQFVMQFKQNDQIVKTKFVRLHRMMLPNTKKHVVYDVKIPAEPYNHIDIFLWNAGGYATTYMDNIQVDILE